MDGLTEDILDLTVELMQYQTTKTNLEERHKCIDHIASYFEVVDVEIRRHEINNTPSLVATYDGASDPEYMLHGHIDVVSVANEDTWDPERKDGKLYGRGSADMKGGVAAMMRLMKDLATAEQPSLGLMITSDEEIGGFDGARHLMNENVYKPSFAVSAEPDTRDEGGMQIVHQQKGVYWLDVATFGQAAHGSRPWKGKNAIELAMKWYNDVKELFENSIKGDWQTTVNLGSLHAGEEFNKVPGTASLKLDIRYTENLKPEQMLAEMIAVDGLKIQTAADITNNFEINDSGVSAEVVGQSLDPADRPDILIRIHDDTPSMFTNPNQKQVQALREAVETTTSQRAILERETGASDMAFFSGNNIPCVVFGPKGRELHDSGEHLDIESLRPFYDTMREFITTDRTE